MTRSPRRQLLPGQREPYPVVMKESGPECPLIRDGENAARAVVMGRPKMQQRLFAWPRTSRESAAVGRHGQRSRAIPPGRLRPARADFASRSRDNSTREILKEVFTGMLFFIFGKFQPAHCHLRHLIIPGVGDVVERNLKMDNLAGLQSLLRRRKEWRVSFNAI